MIDLNNKLPKTKNIITKKYMKIFSIKEILQTFIILVESAKDGEDKKYSKIKIMTPAGLELLFPSIALAALTQ